MADSKKKDDPTVTSTTSGPEYPEGTHPAVPIADGADAGVNKEYRDLKDSEKPAPASVAQVEVRPDEK